MRTSVLIVCLFVLLVSGGCGSREPTKPPTPEELARQKREVQSEDALNMALQLQHNGEYLDEDTALDYLNQAIELDPNQVEALYERAIIFLNRGDLDRAMTDVSHVIEVKPTHVEALFTKAFIQFTRQDYVAAVRWFSRVLKEDDTVSKAYSMRGYCYDTMDRLEDAIYDYTQAIALNPALQEAYYNRGLAYLRTGDEDLALRDLTQAVSLDSQSPKALMARAGAYMRLAKFKRAAGDYRRLTVMTPGDSGVYALLAEALAGDHRYKEAAQAATQAKRLAEAEGDTNAATVYGEQIERFRAEARKTDADPAPQPDDQAE